MKVWGRYAAPMVLLLAGCSRGFSVPAAPGEVTVPVISRIEPRAAYYYDVLTISGRGFDAAAENNVVRFPGGVVETALAADAEHIWVRVPSSARETGPLIVNNRVAASAPSEQEFASLGYGHPIVGTEVAQVRFRHRPVGLVDTAAIILIASTLFDAVLDDSGRFNWVAGRPIAFGRMAQGGGALLSTNSDAGGRVLEIDVATGKAIHQSAPSGVVRVLAYTPGEGLTASSSFRVGARSAGPSTDPSGEWLFMPVPQLDALIVGQ